MHQNAIFVCNLRSLVCIQDTFVPSRLMNSSALKVSNLQQSNIYPSLSDSHRNTKFEFAELCYYISLFPYFRILLWIYGTFQHKQNPTLQRFPVMVLKIVYMTKINYTKDLYLNTIY